MEYQSGAPMTVARDSKERKHRRIRHVIIACLCLVFGLTILETRISQLGEIPFPVSGNVLVFVLINVNVLLLLLMVFLVLRNLVELLFERRKKLLGTRLRTKLVISFVFLSLIPTALLFFIALQFVSTSMDYWFNSTVEQSLNESLSVAKNIYQKARNHVTRQGEIISSQLHPELHARKNRADPEIFIRKSLSTRELDGIELYTDQRKPVLSAWGEHLADQAPPEYPADLFRQALDTGVHRIAIQKIANGELVRAATPVLVSFDQEARDTYLLITSYRISQPQLEQMAIISQGIEGYRQLMLLKNPIKTSLLVMLLIVTLLIIFSAVWFGFYVAQGLTGPIGKLAVALKRVSDGEMDFILEKESDDEMGQLIDSFNMMTRDLATSSQQLEEANRALRESNLELDNRRQYIETILQNVAAGVISFDKSGRITTINRFAEELLGIDKDFFLDKDYRSVLQPSHRAILEGFLRDLVVSGKNLIQRPIRLTVRDETFSLLVNFTKLTDENHQDQGMVLVFDNLTQLEKAQRMAAWREVAQRIAHEVKNPLTPIQLSAQRLRKKYLERLGDDGEVFESCTRTIVNQVEELKRLVSEFSNFARMPVVQKSINNLEDMIREVLVLYEEGHKNSAITFQAKDTVADFSFDRKQIKQVLINLLDNAIAVLPDPGGKIDIVVESDPVNKSVLIEVRDNGPGVADADKSRLFEPYFSTKKSGTGLGLAIAATIVSDHNGTIKVRDNEPTGAVFIVELPRTMG